MINFVDYWKLIVPEYIPMAISTLLVGAVLSTGILPDVRFWFVAAALVCVVGAFNSFNAIADKEIDKMEKN